MSTDIPKVSPRDMSNQQNHTVQPFNIHHRDMHPKTNQQSPQIPPQPVPPKVLPRMKPQVPKIPSQPAPQIPSQLKQQPPQIPSQPVPKIPSHPAPQIPPQLKQQPPQVPSQSNYQQPPQVPSQSNYQQPPQVSSQPSQTAPKILSQPIYQQSHQFPSQANYQQSPQISSQLNYQQPPQVPSQSNYQQPPQVPSQQNYQQYQQYAPYTQQQQQQQQQQPYSNPLRLNFNGARMQALGNSFHNLQGRSPQQQQQSTAVAPGINQQPQQLNAQPSVPTSSSSFIGQNHYNPDTDNNISLPVSSGPVPLSSSIVRPTGSSINYGASQISASLGSSSSISNNSNDTSDDSDSGDDDDDPGIPIGVDVSSMKSSGGGPSVAPPAPAQDTDDSDYIDGKVEIVNALVYMFFVDKSVKTIDNFRARSEEFSPSKYSKLVEESVGYLALRHNKVFEARWATETKAGSVPFELALYKDALYGIHKSKCESIVTSIIAELKALLGDGVYATRRFVFSRELFEGAARVLHGWLFDNVPGFEVLFSKRLEDAGITRAEKISARLSSLWTDSLLGVTSGLEVVRDDNGKPRDVCLKYCIMDNTITDENKGYYWIMRLDNNKVLVAYMSEGRDARNIDERSFIKHMANHVVKERYGMCLHTGFHTQDGEEYVPNFEANVVEWQNKVVRHFGITSEQELPHLREIRDWFSGFRAVHQCSKDALCSILNLGALASLNKLATIWKNPKEIADCVFLSDGMQKLVSELSRTKDFNSSYEMIRRFVRALARKHQCEDGKRKVEEIQQSIANGTMEFDADLCFTVLSGVSPLSEDEKSEYEKLKAEITNAMPFAAQEVIAITNKAIATLINLLLGAKGLKFDVDKSIGTDKCVFAIFGPNRGNYGNAEASVVFKDTIMHHPDTFLTPIAAMGYNQAQLEINRPWDGAPLTWQDGARDIYNKSKFQTVNSDNWTKACAIEWMGRVAMKERKGIRDVTLGDIKAMWRNADPHAAIEAHLPGLISTEYIDKIYITKETEKYLPEALKKKYADLLVVTNDTREDTLLWMERPAWFPMGRGYSFYVKPEMKCVVPVDCSKHKIISFVYTPAPNTRVRDLMINFLSSLGQDKPDAVCWIKVDEPQFGKDILSLNTGYNAINDGKPAQCYVRFGNGQVCVWCNGRDASYSLAACNKPYFPMKERGRKK